MKMQVALGVRTHSGWTALVAIALDEGSPRVLLRERPHLVKDFTYEYRQPYHTAAEMRSSAEAHDFVLRVRSEARILATNAIRSVQSSLGHQGYELKRCGFLLASGKPLPDLPHILASHALIHAADGELFRDAVLYAGERCGLEIFTARESQVFERATHTLHRKVDELGHRLVHLGTNLGSPWTKDEKLAALVAWLSLADLTHARDTSRATRSR